MWLIVVVLVVAGVVALAWWSDVRDRRSEVDPTMRVQALGHRRRSARQRRTEQVTRRLTGQRGVKPTEERPWER